MDFKSFKDRFNKFAEKARRRGRDAVNTAGMFTVVGVGMAVAAADRLKEKLFPSFTTGIENGDLFIVEKELKKNPALASELLASDGTRPLHLAAACDQAGVAALLIEYGASLDVEDRRGVTPLLIAASRGHLPTIELFLQNNDPTLNKLVFQQTETAVSAAASHGHVEALEMLHKGGARLDIANDYGNTVLTEVHEKLVFAQSRGNVDETIRLTACMNYLELNMADIATGADRAANVYTQMMSVASDGNLALAKTLLAADKSDTVNQRYVTEEPSIRVHGNNEMDHVVQTALKEAVMSREPAMVDLLLKNGAKQDIDYEGDATPIILAARYRKPDVLKMLLENDASTVNALHHQKYEGLFNPKRVDFTHSALTHAIQAKDVAMVGLLLDHGARSDLPTTKPALQMAEEAGLTAIVELLKTARGEKAAAGFREGLDGSISAGKPLKLQRNEPKI